MIASHQSIIKEPYLGGLESFTHKIANKYLELGLEVVLFAPKGSKFNGKTSLKDNSNQDNYYYEIFRELASEKFDIIHNNSLSELPIVWAAINNRRMVTTLHTPLYSLLKSSIILYGDYPHLDFVAPSEHMANMWNFLTKKNIKTIYNGIDLRDWKCQRNHSDQIFWYGRVTPHKGTHIAIKVAKEAGLRLKFAGPIGDKDYFDDVIQPLCSKSNADYLGHLNQKEINNELSNSSVSLICPTWDEPFGLSTVESIASGTPVVGFNQGAFPEIVTDGTGIICKRKSIKSLAQNIQNSIILPLKNFTKERSRFCIDKMVANYIGLMEGRVV